MTYTIAVCTVLDSWWCAEELSETCRVLFQKQIWGIIASRWFYYKNEAPQSVGLLWTSDQLVAWPLPDNTQHSQQRDIHARGGIRTRNPSKRGAAAPRLKPRGHPRIGQWKCMCVYCRKMCFVAIRMPLMGRTSIRFHHQDPAHDTKVKVFLLSHY